MLVSLDREDEFFPHESHAVAREKYRKNDKIKKKRGAYLICSRAEL